ncbi:MAG: class I SAM-dependent methyltransferase [Pseudomonadota bacterium]
MKDVAQETWNNRYLARPSPGFERDDWLANWQAELDTQPRGYALDIGAGYGLDSATLCQQGFQTAACDFSEAALKSCHQRVADALPVQLNLDSGRLPFIDDCFNVVCASLTLHYFDWPTTEALCAEIHRCLTPEGILLARFNSVNDIYHGANDGEEIDTNLRLINGNKKRFFTQDCLDRLFTDWEILFLEEKTMRQFEQPKIAWELAAK